MALLRFNNVKISGISACVPKNIHKNKDMIGIIKEEEIEKTIAHIGIEEKRFVDPNVTASDLCFKAADTLLNNLNVDRNSIDVLIFLSQSPDYIIPATSPILQQRLNLPKSTACFDINLACSGYVYGLATAFNYASNPGINKVLFLDGEAFSKIVNSKDKINAPLYGDAGTATLIEKTDLTINESIFSLFTDGSGENAIKIEAGGARKHADQETIIAKQHSDGSYRSQHELFMNGVDVFNFTMREVPKNVKFILEQANSSIDFIDYFIFHQANKFMTDFFAKKLKLPLDKVPYCMHKFGNTSSSSIPLNIVYSLFNFSNKEKVLNLLLSGFGAGLSWSSSILQLQNCHIEPLIEY